MLYFIIPLRSACTTADWLGVQTRLAYTLKSVSNQNGENYSALIICHEYPDQIEIPERCKVVKAPFPRPKVETRESSTEESVLPMRCDKGRKQLFGLSLAREDMDSFVMFLDADDLVSNRLACFVDNHPNDNGWFIDYGYRWDIETPQYVFPRKRFFQECGSSLIIKTSIAPFPDKLDLTKDYSDYFIRRYDVHAYVPENMRKLGYPLKALPFHGAVYTFNGLNYYADMVRGKDNNFRKKLRLLLKGRKFGDALQKEFEIPKIDRF